MPFASNVGSTYTLEVSGGISTQDAMAAWGDEVPLLGQGGAKQQNGSKIGQPAKLGGDIARSMKSVTPM